MATAAVCRRSLARHLVPLTIGVASGVWMVRRQQSIRFDALPPTSRRRTACPEPELVARLDPNVIKQISGGSLSGFLIGVLVSVFSRTLVLLIGLAIVTIQVASRYGIDLIQQLRLKERAKSSRIMSALSENTPFKTSFCITFAMSAFMHF